MGGVPKRMGGVPKRMGGPVTPKKRTRSMVANQNMLDPTINQ